MTAATRVLSALLVVLGAAILLRTAVAGGSGPAIGYIFGVGLIALGAGRLYLARGMGGG